MSAVQHSEEYSTNENSTTSHSSNESAGDLVDNFFSTLKASETEITTEELTKILESLDSNLTFSKFFID
ncbi:hypothetical protein, partial [Salmonella enterica]|uniref:hypothetical protein n=1 Tax=Salmonella enterica TaxID=28901 RepID=UPI0020A39A43